MSQKQQQEENFFEDQLWLGVPDEKINTSSTNNKNQLLEALYNHRIGGQPILMYNTNTAANPNATKEQLEVLKCPTCKSNHDVALLSQVFAPLFDQDRVLYVFICKKCAKALSALQQANKHLDKAIFAVRCQNFTDDAVKKYEQLFGENSANNAGDDEKKKEEEKKTATASKTAFAEEDDWGDDDDTEANKKATAALVNVAAQKQQEEIEKKREQEALEQKRSRRPANKPVVQTVNPVFGLNKASVKGFAEYSLDIYDYDEDAESSEDEDEGDEITNFDSSAQTPEDVKKQLEELKKRYPNAEIVDGNAVVPNNNENNSKAGKDDDDAAEGEGGEEGGDKKNNKALTKKQQEAQRQKELAMEQFDLFVKKLTRQDNTQVIRWHPNGFPLLAIPANNLEKINNSCTITNKKSSSSAETISNIPKCDKCGCDRMFEYQLVSPLIYFLCSNKDSNNNAVAKKSKGAAASSSGAGKSSQEVIDDEEILNFATIIVFTCSNPYCDIGNEYVRDFVIVQQEPVVEQSQIQQQQQAVALATGGKKK